jgi:HEAT repeat protein
MLIRKQTLITLLIASLAFMLTTNAPAHGPIQKEAAVIDINTFPPIEDDIQAIAQYSSKAREAGQRLVERGIGALGHIHHALENPVSFQQQMQLITVLGEIGDPDSVEIIIETTKKSKSRYLYQNSLLALAKFEQQKETIDFVNKQLVNVNYDPLVQRSALTYYAQQPHQDAFNWVKKYNQSNTSHDVRYAALYLGGMLGDTSIKDDILSILQNKQKNTREYYLLLGLSEITSLDEFNQLLEQLELDPNNKIKAQKYAEFRKSPQDKQAELAQELLEKGDSTLKRAAVNYLVKTKNADALENHWKQSNGLVRNSVKRAGYTIDSTDDMVQFKQREDLIDKQDVTPVLIILVTLMAVIGLILFMRKSTAHREI